MDRRKKERRGKRGLSDRHVIRAVELMIARMIRDIKFEKKENKKED